jgi:hypothetical protein
VQRSGFVVADAPLWGVHLNHAARWWSPEFGRGGSISMSDRSFVALGISKTTKHEMLQGFIGVDQPFWEASPKCPLDFIKVVFVPKGRTLKQKLYVEREDILTNRLIAAVTVYQIFDGPNCL